MINQVADGFFIFSNQEAERNNEFSVQQKLDVGHSVGILIKKPRFYGIIYESGKTSKLYLFNILPIPLKVNDRGFIRYHVLFTIFYVLLIIFLLYKKLKGGVKYEEIVEGYVEDSNNFY